MSDVSIGDSYKIAEIIGLAKSIDVEAARGMVSASRRIETTLPVLNPTRWIQESRAIQAGARVCEAFLAFRLVIEAERVDPIRVGDPIDDGPEKD